MDNLLKRNKMVGGWEGSDFSSGKMRHGDTLGEKLRVYIHSCTL